MNAAGMVAVGSTETLSHAEKCAEGPSRRPRDSPLRTGYRRPRRDAPSATPVAMTIAATTSTEESCVPVFASGGAVAAPTVELGAAMTLVAFVRVGSVRGTVVVDIAPGLAAVGVDTLANRDGSPSRIVRTQTRETPTKKIANTTPVTRRRVEVARREAAWRS